MKATAIGTKINPLKLPQDNILGWPFYSRSWDKIAQQISAWNYVCVFAGGSGEGDGGSGDVESLLALGGGSGDEGSGLTGADALAEVLSAQGTFIEDPFFADSSRQGTK